MPSTSAQSLVTVRRLHWKNRVAKNGPVRKIFYNSGGSFNLRLSFSVRSDQFIYIFLKFRAGDISLRRNEGDVWRLISPSHHPNPLSVMPWLIVTPPFFETFQSVG